MLFQNPLDAIIAWFFANAYQIIISALAVIIGWIIYIIIKKQITHLMKSGKLEPTTAKNVQRLTKILIALIIISLIMFQFIETLGLFTSLFSLMGGTIIGFAAINTIGNVIAGFIIMISRPFTVDDYIIHNNKIARVEHIKTIFTLMIDLDGVKISIPNQKLITDETINLGKKGRIRRSIAITADYKEDRFKVESGLIEAAEKVSLILKEPKPFVRITNFQNFAVEYTLFVFIQEIAKILQAEADLRAAILDTMIKYGIDISTPNILKSI
jgi:small-conductance mechanosensitive channel